MIAGEPPDDLSPYRGLTPFGDSELDVLFFFGRDRERELITANLLASRLTVLYGETGAGKSSVLRAGVAHSLRAIGRENAPERDGSNLAVVLFDDWRDDPVDSLGASVAQAIRGTLGETLDPPLGRARLADRLDAWATLAGGGLYLILDQFEDYFLYHDDERGEGTFAEELPELVGRQGLRVNVLLALREDTLAKLDRFKARIPHLFSNYLRLDHLDRNAAREAIVGPLEQYNRLVPRDRNASIEPPLVDAVLDELVVTADGRVETPYLQLVLERLWEAERDAGSLVLRLSTFRDLGGAQRIVESHLEHALATLTEPERDVAASMFDHLVTPSGTKIAHASKDLATWADVDEPVVRPVLSKLASERILRSVPGADGAGDRYEIFHDVLAAGVLGWRSEHEAAKRIAELREHAEQRHRRLLAVLAAGLVLLVVMAGLTVFAFTKRSEARSQAELAHARELAAQATASLDVDPQRSLALAVAAAHLRHIDAVEDVLRQTLVESHERGVLRSGGPLTSASFSPDGRSVLTASDDGTARIWPVAGGPPRILRQSGATAAASFSRDGRLVVTAGRDGAAQIWRTTGGPPVHTLRQPGSLSTALFSPDGALVVTAGADGTARLWSVETGSPVGTLRHPGPVLRASFSRDGALLVTVGSDRDGGNLRARIFDVASRRLVRELAATGVTVASFNPDGRLVVTGSEDHTAAIWRVRDGKRLQLFADHKGGVTDALFGPQAQLVVTTSSDDATRTWDARTGVRLALMLGHVNAVKTAAFSPDGRFLVTGSVDGTARVWEAATGRPEAVLRGHEDSVVDAAFSPDGRSVVTAGADGTARLWDPGTVPELRLLTSAPDAVARAAFSRDGRLVVVAEETGRVRLFSADRRLVRTFRTRAPVVDAALSPDGKSIALAGASGLEVRRTENGGLVVARQLPGGATSVAYSPDARLLAAVASGAETVLVADAASLATTRELHVPGGAAAAAFSPAGRLVATAGSDGVARLWDAASGRAIRALRGHTAALSSVAFSPDGRLLATASRDHDARIWDVASGRMLTLLRGHSGPVFGASFSPDGRWVVTAGPTTAGLWPVSTGRLLLYLHGHKGPLTSAVFDPSSRTILTAGRDGTVRTYRCEVCGGIDGLTAIATARLARIAPRQ